MCFCNKDTAIVLTAPQNEFLHESGVGYPLVMDAYNAAQINFDMLSSGSLTTEEVIAKIKKQNCLSQY